MAICGWLRPRGSVKKASRSTQDISARGVESLRAEALIKLKAMERRQDQHPEEGTWAETVDELSKGWIWEATGESLDGKVIARRSGLQQGAKLRVMDDCSCGGLNHSVGLAEKFQLHSIDQLASIVSHSFSMTTVPKHPKLVGRTYDLRAAYKQFPLSAADREEILRIAVCNPGQSAPSIFGVNALPFGAVGSVPGFLRISHALWFIGAAASAGFVLDGPL